MFGRSDFGAGWFFSAFFIPFFNFLVMKNSYWRQPDIFRFITQEQENNNRHNRQCN